MLSDKETTTKIVGISQNGLALVNFTEDYGHLLLPSVQSSWDAVAAGNKPLLNPWGQWYVEMPLHFSDCFNALMGGKMTQADFSAKMDAETEKVKADSSIPKYIYE